MKSAEFPSPICCLQKVHDFDLILVGLSDGQIEVYNLENGISIKTISAHSKSAVFKIHLLSNGNVISGSGDGEIKLIKIIEETKKKYNKRLEAI